MAISLKSQRVVSHDLISVSPSGSVTVNALVTTVVEANRRGAERKYLELIFEGTFHRDGETKTKRMPYIVELKDIPVLVERIQTLIEYCNVGRANIANREEISVELAPGITAGAALYENTVFQDFFDIKSPEYGAGHFRLTGGNNLSRILKVCAQLTAS
jgi:hypothetical protein